MQTTNTHSENRFREIISQIRGYLQKAIEPSSYIQEIGARHRAQLLATLSLILLIPLSFGFITSIIMQKGFNSGPIVISILLFISVVVYVLSRTRYYMIGSVILTGGLSLSGYMSIMMGSDNDPVSSLFSTLPIAFLLGSVLLPFKGMAALVIINLAAMLTLPLTGKIEDTRTFITGFGIFFSMGILFLIVIKFRNDVERDRLEEVGEANLELKELQVSLEERVEERTRAIEISTEVSRRLSTVLDRRQLVNEVVEQLQSAFDYYHVHIYLLDSNRKNLIMAGGTGEPAKKMLAQGHTVEIGNGLVGQAAETNSTVLVPDVSIEPGWLSNPLLPETKSEIAVPISIGTNVQGVIDVQHNITNGLDEEDEDLVQSIANQVAVALQNAEAYTQAQYMAEREMMVSNINQHIQRATTVDDVLKVAVRELGQVLDAQKSSVQIGE
jgi:putative methionine-R-sulfoxide reductase with GAF domain